MSITIIRADYANRQHAQDIQNLLDSYARDPMGGGQALPPAVKSNIVQALAELPHAFSLLAYSNDQAVGLANCFEAFSTFYCKPVINIHDFTVIERFRGQGISQLLLRGIEDIAKAKGSCKITLEVLSNNNSAQSAYKKFGFTDYQLAPQAGHALFWQKIL